GRVDIHDQLRQQRCLLQLAVRFRKYYMTIFLGPVDMAIGNALIVYRNNAENLPQITHNSCRF
ncbi:hypothetical protein PHMEG_00039172, partial [Phytophthora megakarya]